MPFRGEFCLCTAGLTCVGAILDEESEGHVVTEELDGRVVLETGLHELDVYGGLHARLAHGVGARFPPVLLNCN